MRERLMRLFAVGRRGRRDAELDEELQFHVDELTAAFERQGLDRNSAREAAERELGGIDRTKQAWRDQRTWPAVEELLQDVRFGVRVLRRSPALSVGAGLMLAVAIAASVSVFAVVDAVLLAPLPYGRPWQLVALFENFVPMHAATVSVAPGNFLEWRDRARSISAMTAIEQRQQNLTSDGDPQQVSVAAVSEGFAPTVEVSPTIGRMFSPSEFQPGRDDVAMIGYGLWSARFGRDARVVGRKIVLDDRPYTVIGVMPAGFLFPAPGPELWTPLPMTAADRENRSGKGLGVVARLRDGVSIAAAERELHGIAEVLKHDYPKTNGAFGITVQPAREALVGDTSKVLATMLAAVGLLLLVACANIGGLLLTHGMARSREIAIRAALGADRWRVIRQLLTESVVLSLVAGAVGVALAWAAQPLLARLRPTDFLAWKPIWIDGRALGFAVAAAVGSAALFGTLPAIAAARFRLIETASMRSGGRAAARARQTLIAFELALAFVLVAVAVLVGETLYRLTSTDLGFDPDGVVTMSLSLPAGRYTNAAKIDAFYDAVFERIRALPSVRAAGATHALPLSGYTSVRPYRVFGAATHDERPPVAHYRIVTPGYVEAMRIPVRAGRSFTASDTADHPLAIVINETLRREAFGEAPAIGARMSFGGGEGNNAQWGEVVGVVADVRHFGASAPATAEMYWPSAQLSRVASETLHRLRRSTTIVIRTDGDPLAVVPAVRAAVRAVDPDQPIATVRTMASLVGASLWLSRASVWLMSIFGSAAALFALLGVFASASYAVAQRRRELAVRLALGAAPGSVARTAVRGALAASIAGILAGLAIIGIAGRALQSLFAGMPSLDVRTLGAAGIALATATAIACWSPARRAARVDPIQALRTE